MGLLESRPFRELISKLYGEGEDTLKRQISRYRSLISTFQTRFGKGDVHLFSTPGRAEIAGNHTDHNDGLVLAGSVHLDTIAVARRTDSQVISVFSEGFPAPFEVNIANLEARAEERETTAALIRGIAARVRELGYKAGGFNAVISSNVGIGSGLSSSASIEVLLTTIVNCFYNGGEISMLELAKIGQYAENNYFMKPCGLMDQIACGFGGIVAIDFADSRNPVVDAVDFDLTDFGYNLLVVRTGSDHADLTEDYAAIPEDMRSAAAIFDKRVCRELSLADIMDNVPLLRHKAGDRSLLRAYHFLTENERVSEQVAALQNGDMRLFLSLVQNSGYSSALWLQNSFCTRYPKNQPVTVTLALTEHFFRNREGGAYRVHGGGFAGTIQVFMPEYYCDEYIDFMESRIGRGAVTVLRIRTYGSIHINELIQGNSS
jgi:galactokinase